MRAITGGGQRNVALQAIPSWCLAPSWIRNFGNSTPTGSIVRTLEGEDAVFIYVLIEQ